MVWIPVFLKKPFYIITFGFMLLVEVISDNVMM